MERMVLFRQSYTLFSMNKYCSDTHGVGYILFSLIFASQVLKTAKEEMLQEILIGEKRMHPIVALYAP